MRGWLRLCEVALIVPLLGPGLASADDRGPERPKARAVRTLGFISEFRERVVVPVDGSHFRFVAKARSCYRRSTLSASASALPQLDRPRVQLNVSGDGLPQEVSAPDCLEKGIHAPPLQACTIHVGTRWKGCSARDVVLFVENLGSEPVTVDLAISVLDPLE